MNFQSITVHCTNLTETETNWSAAAAGSHMKHAPAQLITAQPQLDLLLEGTKPSLAAIAMNAGQYFLGVDFFNNLIFLEFLKLINLTTWFFSVTWRLLLTSLQIYQEAINCYTSRYPAFRAISHKLQVQTLKPVTVPLNAFGFIYVFSSYSISSLMVSLLKLHLVYTVFSIHPNCWLLVLINS